MGWSRIGGWVLAALLLAASGEMGAGAKAGEAEAQKLVAAAQGRLLVITWSPLNRMLIALERDGRMSVIGTGLRHCDGPHGGSWQMRDGRFCLSTPWSTPCFDVTMAGEGFELKEDGERSVYTHFEDGPLGRCTPRPSQPNEFR